MYHNATTNELTNVAPWGNHYYDDDLKAELFADWSEVADAYVPTITLTTEQKLTALDTEYQTQFDALVQALGAATLASDTDLISALQEEYATLKAQYTAAREAIEND